VKANDSDYIIPQEVVPFLISSNPTWTICSAWRRGNNPFLYNLD